MSYANVAATLALVIAAGGGTAWAANHYLITSTKQIKPSVLSELKGSPGQEGPPGANGANGTSGTDGTDGTNGTNGAGPGYSATIVSDGSLDVSINSEKSIVTKTVPAGSYIVHANVDLQVTENDGTTYNQTDFQLRCKLLDNAAVVDTADWWGSTTAEYTTGNTVAFSTIPLDAAVSSSTTNALEVECENAETPSVGTITTNAYNAALTAVQTTGNS
jgi:hypothetical protein